MNGAESLIRTLVNGGVDLCFTNPGTSEMHFVAAVDRVPAMRTVLGLFEGVCTGAADGYARMTGRPAATLLHLGPGLGNGLANLHNARRAFSPLINIVGDHATYHLQYDAPLTSDIVSIARGASVWIRSCQTPKGVAQDAVDAIIAACQPPGQIATLILPADCAWSESGPPLPVPPPPSPAPVDRAVIREMAALLRRGEPTVILLAGPAMLEPGIRAAQRIAQATGARVLGTRLNSRTQRGGDRPAVTRLPYPVPQAVQMLAGTQHLILVGAEPPVGFFAYPNLPSLVYPTDCQLYTLATMGQEMTGALQSLAEELGAGPEAILPPSRRPELPVGPITAEKVWVALTALMPEESIICDEGITSSRAAENWTSGAPRHDWLNITGGAIGQGLPLATGAAVACPDRQVFAMQADGSAMYTLQALWTQAREQLDVVTVLFNNRAYAILQGELERVGADPPGPKARQMLDLGNPVIDWVHLAQGMGVEASRAETAEAFADQLTSALGRRGPHLIEVML